MTENRINTSSASFPVGGSRTKTGSTKESTDFTNLLQSALGKTQSSMTDSLLDARAKTDAGQSQRAETQENKSSVQEKGTRENEGTAKTKENTKRPRSEESDEASGDVKAGEQEVAVLSLLLQSQEVLPAENRAAAEEGLSDLEGLEAVHLESVLPETDTLVDFSTLAEETAETGFTLPEDVLSEEAAQQVQTALEGRRDILSETGKQQPAEVTSEKTESLTAAKESVSTASDQIQELPKDAAGLLHRAEETGEKQEDTEENEDAASLLAESLQARNSIVDRNVPEGTDTAVLKTTETSLKEDVSELIASRMQRNQGDLVITLEPRNLGQIVMRISYVGTEARVNLTADNPRTLELLTRNAQEMAQIIEQKTGTMTAVLIDKQEEGQSLSGQNQNSQTDSDNKERAEEEQRARQQALAAKGGSEDFLQQMRLGLL